MRRKRTVRVGSGDECPLQRCEFDSGYNGNLWHCYWPGRKKDDHGHVMCDHMYIGDGCPLKRTDLVLTLKPEAKERPKKHAS
jgi:hypothetical protein